MKTLIESPSRSHKYLRLAKYFREQIQSGALKPGDRLPSFAQMQAEHGIGQGTLERAYTLLEEEHIIIREPKRGTFVAKPRSRTALGVIGVASGRSPGEHPYYLHLLEGIQDIAYREKVELLLLHDLSSAKWEKMDGLITMGFPLLNTPPLRVPLTMPSVALVMPEDGHSRVMADDFHGAKAATEHLLALGHRRIAFLVLGGDKPQEYITLQRMKGYHAALHEAGIEIRRGWIRSLRDPWENMKPFANLGYEKMKGWLEADWEELGCTAILAHNDETAIGIMRALREAGIQVPQQVSVMGFDGTELADHAYPRLSTVVVPLHDIGARGLELLLRQIDRSLETTSPVEPEIFTEVLPTWLKIQDSTAKYMQK